MDGEGGASGAGATELTGDQGGAGGGDGGAGGGAAPAWLAGLPEDLRGDATLSRFADVEALGRGFLETRQLAKSKLSIPAADAAPEAWAPVFDALGRPAAADAYDFGLEALPADADEGAKTARAEMAKRYGDLFHPLGLNNAQAAALVKADVERFDAAVKAHNDKAKAEIDSLKTDLGADYQPQLDAAAKVYNQLFPDRTFADALDDHLGSRVMLEGLMKLAKVAGEHGRVDGGGGGFEGGDNPQAQLDARMADQSWREKYNKGDQQVVAEYHRLLTAAQARAGA